MGLLFFCCSPYKKKTNKKGRSNASKRADQTLLKCLVCVEIKKSDESRPRKWNEVTKEVVEMRDEAEEKRDGGEDLRWEVAGFDVL